MKKILIAVDGTPSCDRATEAVVQKHGADAKAGKVQIPLKLIRRGEFKGDVVLAPSSLPPNVRPATVTIDAKTDAGNLEIALPPNAPV